VKESERRSDSKQAENW